MERIAFWKRVKPLMKAHKMTQRQLAGHLEVSPYTLRNWIYYDRIPTLAHAYAIAFAFGVSLDYLMCGKDRDITSARLKEIELRIIAARIKKMQEKILKELQLMRPLTE